MFKRVVAISLVMLLSVSVFTGCSKTAVQPTEQQQSTVEKEEKKDKEVVVALASDVASMDPHTYNETVSNSVRLHIFDTLVAYDYNLQSIPSLAENWEIKEDGVTWIFNLRKGVKFHNGNDFNADDVIYNFDRIKLDSEEFTSAFSSKMGSIESYRKIDDYTVEVITLYPNPMLLTDIRTIMILDKEYTEEMTAEEISLNPVGTGRYKLVEHIKQDHIDLIRNEEYWGEEPPIKKVRIRPITNEATRTAAMLSGEIDLTVDIGVRDVDKLNSNPDIDIIQQPSLRLIFLNLGGWEDNAPKVQPSNPSPLKDIRVRQAIYHAIDEDAIVDKVMNGHAYVTGSLVHDYFVGYNPEVKRLEYDPQKAKALLAEAGYPDGFTITLDAPNDRYVNDEKTAIAVAGYLEKVGIKVELNLLPKSIFFKTITAKEYNSSFSMSGTAFSAGEGVNFLKYLLYTHGSKSGYGTLNRGHYSNTKIDELTDTAFITSDVDKRGELVKEAFKIASDDVAIIPLHFQEDIFAKKKNIIYKPRPTKHFYAWDMDITE